MRIGFVNAPRADGWYIGAEDCCVSLGTARLLPARLLACASEAKRAGHDVLYCDASLIRGDLPACDALVYPIMWQSHKSIHKQVVARAGGARLLPLAIPPGYAHHYARLDPPPAAVIYSEAEAVIPTLPQSARDFDAWRESAPGAVWLDGDTLRDGGQLPNCMAELGSVDYSLVPQSYWKFYPQAAYQVTRGCYHACTFCMWGASTVTDRAFKMRSPDITAADVQSLREHAGKAIHLYLLCAQLTPNLAWLRRFCELMERDPYPFDTNVNLLEVTDEKIDLLKRAGMIRAVSGLEAVTDKTLAIMHKGHNVEQAINGIEVLERSGMNYRLHLRCGYGESREDALEAVAALERVVSVMKPRSQLDLGPIVYYEGTEIRDCCKYELIPHPDYVEYCPIQADTPWDVWMKFASEMARRGLLYKRGLKGIPKQHMPLYYEFVGEWRDGTTSRVLRRSISKAAVTGSGAVEQRAPRRRPASRRR